MYTDRSSHMFQLYIGQITIKIVACTNGNSNHIWSNHIKLLYYSSTDMCVGHLKNEIIHTTFHWLGRQGVLWRVSLLLSCLVFSRSISCSDDPRSWKCKPNTLLWIHNDWLYGMGYYHNDGQHGTRMNNWTSINSFV